MAGPKPRAFAVKTVLSCLIGEKPNTRDLRSAANSAALAVICSITALFLDFGARTTYVKRIDPRRVTLCSFALAPDICCFPRKSSPAVEGPRGQF